MTDRIEPALSAAEWAREDAVLAISAEKMRVLRHGPHAKLLLAQPGHEVYVEGASRLAKLIALANAVLKDDDKRKITHRTVAMLRDAARVAELEGNAYEDLLVLADALASYLPPDPDEAPVYPRLDATLEQKLNRQL